MGYEKDRYWRELQPFLPHTNQLTDGNVPAEYYLHLDSFNIHIDHYECPSPKGRLVLFHGVGGNGRLLSFIALPLRRAGYEVICPDMPLYGYTEYSGTVSYDDWVTVGSAIVLEYQKDDIPLFVFGLSAGGMLAYQVACRCSCVNGIIATCLLDQRDRSVTRATASSPIMGAMAVPAIALMHHVIPNFKLPMKAIADMKNITNNRAVADMLMKDSKSSGVQVSLEFIHSMLNPSIEVEPEEFTNCPLLLVHPGEDRWTDVSLSRKFFDRLSCGKELRMLKSGGHFPLEPEALQLLERYILQFLGRSEIKDEFVIEG